MSLTVVGSIAFDSVKTPFGERERMLGGTAVHFSLAASFFTEVRPVGPVGEDFGAAEFEVLERRGVIVDDIEQVEGGRSFFWRGRYEYDLNVAHTGRPSSTSSASSSRSSPTPPRPPTSSSSPTSSRTSSARSAPSAARRASAPSTR